MRKLWIVGIFAFLAAFTSSALADDWLADKLRGPVQQFVDRQWQPLARGMIVPDNRMIRTLAAGHVTFTRGAETIDVGPDTQIQIYDKGGSKPFTTVKQSFGTVAVEAQVQNVQHFAVDTPYLAAVVKGTRFVVTTRTSGTTVEVHRGHVEVDAKGNRTHVVLGVGQSATVDMLKTGGSIVVSGTGKLPEVLNGFGSPVGTTSSTTTSSGGTADSSGGSSGSGASTGGLGVSVNAGSGAVTAAASLGAVSAGAGAGSGGVVVGASVGSTSLGVSAGTGGLNVNLGRIHLGL